jgi:hypothetical protein
MMGKFFFILSMSPGLKSFNSERNSLDIGFFYIEGFLYLKHFSESHF